MNPIRLIAVGLICAMLAFPAFVTSDCYCAKDAAPRECDCCAPSVAKAYRAAAAGDETSCCAHKKSAGRCESTCRCPADLSSEAILPTGPRDRDVPVAAMAPWGTANAPIPVSASFIDHRARPSPGHHQRQATLCVWRN